MIKKPIHSSFWTQGDDIEIAVNINQTGGLDITSWDFQAQLRGYETNNLIYQVNADKSDLANNNVSFSIPSSATAAFEVSPYIMDLVYEDAGGARRAFLSIDVKIEKGRTVWQ